MNTENSFPNARANVGFRQYSGANFGNKALGIFVGMSSTTYFPAPPTPMPDLLIAVQEYQTLLGTATSTRDKNSIILKKASRRSLTAILVALGNYVTLTANGDMDALLTSGFTIRKINEPGAPLQAPTNIVASDGTNSGEIKVSVDTVKGAGSYIHGCMALPVTQASVWVNLTTTSASATFKGLTKQTEYLFHVGAVGVRGQVTYSNTVTRISQ